MRAACRYACVCVFNPAYASVENTHVWPMAWADVVSGGLTPQAAVEKAFKRVEEIFAKYPIVQSQYVQVR